MTKDATLQRIVLASASPRRQRLISWLGIDAAVAVVDVDERLDEARSPQEIAKELAMSKALAAGRNTTDSICLGFDTIVVLDGRPLGKPATDDEARAMLAALSGRHHSVVTGVAIVFDGAVLRSLCVETDVEMRSLSPREVEAWLARGEHLGCAGAYNIEHHLAHVTEDECYQNVAGLPLCHLYHELAEIDGAPLRGLVPPVARCDAALGRRCLLGPRVCRVSR